MLPEVLHRLNPWTGETSSDREAEMLGLPLEGSGAALAPAAGLAAPKLGVVLGTA